MTNTEPRRLHSLYDPEGGYVVLHWRCTEAEARHYAEINHPSVGDQLVGPTGLILATY